MAPKIGDLTVSQSASHSNIESCRRHHCRPKLVDRTLFRNPSIILKAHPPHIQSRWYVSRYTASMMTSSSNRDGISISISSIENASSIGNAKRSHPTPRDLNVDFTTIQSMRAPLQEEKTYVVHQGPDGAEGRSCRIRLLSSRLPTSTLVISGRF